MIAADGKAQCSTEHLRLLISDPELALTSITGFWIEEEKKRRDDLLLNVQYIYVISLFSFFCCLSCGSYSCVKVIRDIKSNALRDFSSFGPVCDGKPAQMWQLFASPHSQSSFVCVSALSGPRCYGHF